MRKVKFLSQLALVSILTLGVVSCEKATVEPTPEQPEQPEAGKPFVMEDFTVTLNAIHSGDVFLTIEPENKEMTYWYQLQVTEDMPKTDEEILASDIDYLKGGSINSF